MINKILAGFIGKNIKNEQGEIMLITLIFVMMGFLMIVPLVAFMGSGLKSARVFDNKADTLYAADAGIEDAIWQIKYEHLASYLNDPVAYDEFDFTTEWEYTLPEEPNQQTVTVTIQNDWIPKDIPVLSESEARAIADSGRLLVTGGMVGGTTDQYKATITYFPQAGEDLAIDSIGIWMPPGFTYDNETSNVEEDPVEPYYSVPTVSDHKGGHAIVWDFESVDILDFPEVDTLDSPMTFDVSFSFTAAKADTVPDMVCWLETSGVDGLEFCWDFDVKVFQIGSQAGETHVETCVAKSELRQLNGALNGDYSATGNTLIEDAVYDSGHIRDTWLDATEHSSTASISDIDEDAEVAAAFLYWTAWYEESEITKISPLNPEDCADTLNWTADVPNDWSVSSGTYRAHTYSGYNHDIALTNAIDLSTYSDAKVALSWEQKVGGSSNWQVFLDNCTTLNNWTAGAAWSISADEKLMGHYSGADSETAARTVTSNAIDLSSYSGTMTISWNQSKVNLESGDELYYALYSPTYGWSGNTRIWRGYEIINSTYSFNPYSYYRTSEFRIRFYVKGCTETNEFCYLDNIAISFYTTPSYSSLDGLDFAIYNSDTGWSSNIEAFRGNIGTTLLKYHYFLPPQYITSEFKVRFSPAGCSDPAEYVYIDNIYLRVMYPDDEVFFEINDRQVYYDEEGEPAEGYYELTADTTEVILNITNNVYKGFSYTGFKDVTELVKNYSDGADLEGDPPAFGYGNADYTTGNVDATLGIDGGDYQLAHAGWALIVVYTSPNTFGHQLYLYDRFTYADDYQDLDFDKNDTPGGDISGFIVPERVRNDEGVLETNAAKITCFVGEGDNWITGEFIALNAPEEYWDSDTTNFPPSAIPVDYKLWDGFDTSLKSNVWNSLSTVCSADGVDVDTFTITWDSGLISEGDTTAHIDFYTNSDNWNMIFMILAFRSEVTTGGALTYLIQG